MDDMMSFTISVSEEMESSTMPAGIFPPFVFILKLFPDFSLCDVGSPPSPHNFPVRSGPHAQVERPV